MKCFVKNYGHGGGHRTPYLSNPSEGTTHQWDKRPKKEDKLCLQTVSRHNYWLLPVSEQKLANVLKLHRPQTQIMKFILAASL